VTYHPVTLEYEQTEWQVGELLKALLECAHPVVFTMPNADTNGRVIMRMLEEFVASHPRAQIAKNLGTQGYFSLMACAAAMVGNSSSGIIEAPSFGLPVVNIGTRQLGRSRTRNVIDVGYGRGKIMKGIRTAIDPEFRVSLKGLSSPYGDGHAAERILEKIKSVALGEALIKKRFHEFPYQGPESQRGRQVGRHLD
jgi:UDP-N-acetylglucosamine 2-epimerase (non-hydrolysing)/GDP/UDP-N,N'-diacetylbacillosamine 2-epimerase (hydrolysing)